MKKMPSSKIKKREIFLPRSLNRLFFFKKLNRRGIGSLIHPAAGGAIGSLRHKHEGLEFISLVKGGVDENIA